MMPTMEPRVLQVMAGEEHGGAESYFVAVVGALQQAGLHQRVIIKHNAVHEQKLRACGVEPISLPFATLFDRQTIRAISQQIDDFQPTIIHTWMYQATRATPIASDAVHIGWLRGYEHLADYQGCDQLIAMSRGVMESIALQGWPDDRIHHIRPYADDRSAAPLPRSAFDTPDDAYLLLSLGRLHWHKAFDTLLQAMAQLKDSNIYLWLAGEGDERTPLEEMAASMGLTDNIRFLGWQEDRAPLYAAADCVVVPSRYEPFGLVMIEAWAQKKPLIVTKAASARATVQDEVDGLLVPIDDIDALAKAILRVQDDDTLRQGLAVRGYEHYLRDYTRQRTVEQFMQVYNTVLQKGVLASRTRSRLSQWKSRALAQLGME